MEIEAPAKDLKIKVTDRQILSIALPITLAILVPQINMLTNSIFLGDLSTAALGNAGVTGVFYLIFAVIGNGFNNALQSVFSRYAGAGNPGEFKVIFAQGLRIALQFAIAGILVTWFIAPVIFKMVADPAAYPQEISFLKIRILGLPFLYFFQLCNALFVASLNSRYLMIGFICEAALNIVLDYGLIKGRLGLPFFGFNGAAIASVISEIFGLIVVLIVLWTTGLKRKFGIFRTFKYDKTITKQILNISAPLVLQYFISVTTWLVFFFLIEARHDATAKAISNTMRNFFGLIGVFVWAFASTCNTMVSNLMGQMKYDQVLRAIGRIMMWSVGFCFLMCVLINVFPVAFFNLFGQNEDFVREGIPVIRVVSVGLLFMSIANVWLNGVTGTAKTKMNLLIEVIAITIYLIYTWIFMKVHYISLAMAWSNEFVYWSTIFLISFTYLRSGKWRPTFT